MKMILTALLMLLCASPAWATAQVPDRILLDGEEYNLHNNPLEPYFDENPDERPETLTRSTANWRGYVATFTFKGKSLILNDIAVEVW
ncbi:MAG: hypothetical protein AB8C95_10140, partial [Phycisphaeraceae bacterium]